MRVGLKGCGFGCSLKLLEGRHFVANGEVGLAQCESRPAVFGVHHDHRLQCGDRLFQGHAIVSQHAFFEPELAESQVGVRQIRVLLERESDCLDGFVVAAAHAVDVGQEQVRGRPRGAADRFLHWRPRAP